MVADREALASSRTLVFLAAGLALAVALLLAPEYAQVKDSYAYGLRVTARIAFVFFLLAYVARPLLQTLHTGRWLVRNRRYLGLSAALAHTVHFVYIVLYFRASQETIDVVTYVFGGLAFVLFWIMAATSNKPAIRAMGAWWGRVHTFGMHYIWIVFAQSWIGAAVAEPWYWLFAAPALAGLGLRLWASIQRRQPASLAAGG